MTADDLAAARFLASITRLRPWWWRLNPWRYIREVEDHLCAVYDALEEERETMVISKYVCPRCGNVG